ncbi:hypothetical protein [Mycolicibacter longobardus]|uniref:hypothetical protein n=1 Tax=Mycolicibacter longobardus TaxID=1108812 RepID=UPI000A15FFFC|nr:hypothetical protein [Mycolicibacter longobardus]MCV7383865.1 hypothetical protein [Mycolicibacter longobardus]
MGKPDDRPERPGGGGWHWPSHLFGGRVRTSTVVLIIAFVAVWWVYDTYREESTPPAAPQVVPPGFIPDPAYTWVPRTRVQQPQAPTETPTPTPTPTTTEEPTPTESPTSEPSSPTPVPGFPFCPPLCPPPDPTPSEQPEHSTPSPSPSAQPTPSAPPSTAPTGAPTSPPGPGTPHG